MTKYQVNRLEELLLKESKDLLTEAEVKELDDLISEDY